MRGHNRPKREGSDPSSSDNISRRDLGILFGKVGLMVGGTVLGINTINNNETDRAKRNLVAKKENLTEVEKEGQKLKAAQETFKSKFGFPAELEIPVSLRQVEASPNTTTEDINNQWLRLIKSGATTIEAVTNNYFLNNQRLLAGLKDVKAKKWLIPAKQNPNIEANDKILEHLIQAMIEPDKQKQQALLKSIGFEF